MDQRGASPFLAPLKSAVVTVGTAIADEVGVTGVSNAGARHESVNAEREQTTTERVMQGTTGTVKLVSTATGMVGAGRAVGGMVSKVERQAGKIVGQVEKRAVGKLERKAAGQVDDIVEAELVDAGQSGAPRGQFRDAAGKLRNADGTFAPDGGKVKQPSGSVHGNSHATQKPAQGYTLRDKDTGEVLKYGETTDGKGRYSAKYLEDNNAEMVFEESGTKAEMHQWQHQKILDHKAANGGQRPRLNKNDY